MDFVEYGVGLAYTKQDFDEHVRSSEIRHHVNEPIADDYFTFAVQRCGGELAKWRAQQTKVNPPLKFVFDLTPKKGRDEISKVFFGGVSGKPQFVDGMEQWFVPESIAYESRKDVVQLLSADMLAWVTATIRARESFGRGETLEMFQIADIFVETKHIHMGRTLKESFAQWEKDVLDATKTG